MATRRNGIERGAVGPERLSESISTVPRFVHDTFGFEPFCWSKSDSNGAPTGTGGDENLINTGIGRTYEYHIIGTQTIVAPNLASAGLNWALDQTEDDGVEVNFGGILGRGRFFIVGDDDFYAKLHFTCNQTASIKHAAFGFRKVAAYQADIEDYTDMAVINLQQDVINTQTILNNGATTTTDSGTTSSSPFKFEIHVTGRQPRFFSSGTELNTTLNFNFDAQEKLTPFFYMVQGATPSNAVRFVRFECGLKEDNTEVFL